MASKLVIITVFVVDLIAFGLAVAAEQRRNVGKPVMDNEKEHQFCVYDSDIATSYGAGAFMLLLISQVLVMAASRCFCCGKALNPGGSRACAILLFLVCWIFFLTAEICLLAASIRNAYHTKYTRKFFEDAPSCQVIRKGVFAAGAAFTLFTAIVSQFYYICYSRARDDYQKPPY
ncbi:PREDICTED: uncharacterized protein LOC104810486 [Tarenaya hassleriana]|uniref:uncharacterized protein LOC104810486 n=1 Tax=Tarenaya hassleriana TaxID=28532 RepID=UPI00053C4A0A|nr:PREDICTED: uncharacterized protein LOC104810486 [Tarenaya hassleriana]